MKTEFSADQGAPDTNPELANQPVRSTREMSIEAQAFQADRVAIQRAAGVTKEEPLPEPSDEELIRRLRGALAVAAENHERQGNENIRLRRDLHAANEVARHNGMKADQFREELTRADRLEIHLRRVLDTRTEQRDRAHRALVVSGRVWMVCSTIGAIVMGIVGWAIHG